MSELVSISIQQNSDTEFVGTCEGWVGEPVVDTSERRVRENLAEKICEAIEFWDDTSEICVPKGRGVWTRPLSRRRSRQDRHQNSTGNGNKLTGPGITVVEVACIAGMSLNR